MRVNDVAGNICPAWPVGAIRGDAHVCVAPRSRGVDAIGRGGMDAGCRGAVASGCGQETRL